MSEKPNHRHSFLNPARTDKEKLSVNRFGHTILGGQLDKNVLPHEEMDVTLDPSGDIVASRKSDIFEHPAIKEWAANAGIHVEVFYEEQEDLSEASVHEELDHSPALEVSRSLFDHLPSNLDELARESLILSANNPMDGLPKPSRLNRSSPQEIQITLPAYKEESRSAESASVSRPPIASQHCSSCNGAHPNNARFCPHCGIALTRFCIHCGYQFTGSEKFCPDCGERR